MSDDLEIESRRLLNKSRLRRGLTIALALSAVSLIIISLLTLDRDTFTALSNLSPFFLFLAVVLSLGRWLWSALRMRILVKSTGERVPFRNIVKTVYGGYFTGLITPWRAGGVTGEAVFLYIYGLGAGEAVAVVSFGACISTFLLILFFPLAIWLASVNIDFSVTLQGFVFSALGIGIVFLAVVLLALLKPDAAVSKTLARYSPSFLKKRGWYRRFLDRLSAEIRTFGLSLRRIVGLGGTDLAAVVSLTLLYWVSGFMAVPVALVGLGYGSFFWKAIVAQLVIQILLPFVPTPGSSGIGEVGFLFVYNSILPEVGVAALLTLIWRFIDFYLGLLVGGSAFLIIMRDLARSPRHKPQEHEHQDGPGGVEGPGEAGATHSREGERAGEREEDRPGDRDSSGL